MKINKKLFYTGNLTIALLFLGFTQPNLRIPVMFCNGDLFMKINKKLFYTGKPINSFAFLSFYLAKPKNSFDFDTGELFMKSNKGFSLVLPSQNLRIP